MDQHSLKVLEFKKIINIVKEYAATDLAKEVIGKLSPVSNYDYVKESIAEVTSAKKILEEFGRPGFGGITDIRKILKKAGKDIVLKTEEIDKLYSTLLGFRSLKEYFNNILDETDPEIIENEYKIIIDKSRSIILTRELEAEISKTIDEYGDIRDNASSKLRSLRREMEKIEGQVRGKLQEIIKSQKYKNMLQDSLVTRRENRYVVPIKQKYRSSFSGIVHDQSSSGMTIFMEPMSVVKLNNRLREMKSEEEAEIYRILQVLTSKVKKDIESLKSNLKLVSVLDVAFARARYSVKIDGTAPEINQSGNIEIKKGRHPLLKEDPVPIDVKVGDKFDTLVITGPNTGGKTVTLKTIGLFTLMTSAGLHIPAARGTVISLFNNIFADIGDEQSIEQSLSTFSSHMNKIKKYINQAGDDSLVLLDELGVGTDPREGAALGISILERLKANDVTTVATTHYSQLKSYAYSSKGVENASVEFDIETLRPTYRLIMGVPGGSNAFDIALRLGVPEDLIKRAKELSDEGDLKVESIISDLNKQRKKYRNLKNEFSDKSREVEKLKEEYNNKLNSLKEKKKIVVDKAYEKADKIVKKAKKESKQIIKSLKKKDYTSKPEVDRMATETNKKLKKVDEEYQPEEEAERKKEIDETIKKGDQVRIMSLGQKGQLLIVDRDKNEAKVQAGAMKVTVGLEDLVKVDKSEDNKDKVVKKYRVKKSKSASQKLDLRGKRYEEAQNEVDKYLDDAFLAGFKKVEIIHGKGTGALRKAVHGMLEDHPHVSSFRLGRQKEGGSGATIVTLGN